MVTAVPAFAKSQYDQDGFTIFPTKSFDYMHGYRDGVLQADQDIKEKPNIDANQDHVKCPPQNTVDYCAGFKDGYSDEAMDQLE